MQPEIVYISSCGQFRINQIITNKEKAYGYLKVDNAAHSEYLTWYFNMFVFICQVIHLKLLVGQIPLISDIVGTKSQCPNQDYAFAQTGHTDQSYASSK